MSEPRHDIAQGLHRLLEWAGGIGFEDLPPTVVRKAVLILADNLAATVAARDEPGLKEMLDKLAARDARPEATLFRGGATRVERHMAALGNGTASNWCELDEGYRKAPCHPGIYVIPGLLAEAEAEGLGVGETLRALALGYEITGRIAEAFPDPKPKIQPHARFAAIGSAAAIGLARRLPADTMFAALNAAATLSPAGPQNHVIKGAMIENTWTGVGVESGMRCSEWAALGIGGVADSLYDVYADALGAGCAPERLTDGLGEDWAVLYNFHKIYATCGRTHSAVESLLALMPELPEGDPTEWLERVELDVHDPELCNAAPETSLGARFSFPHVIASMLVHRHADNAAFSGDKLNDPRIAALRPKVVVRQYDPPQPWPKDRGARVHVRLKDGRVLSHATDTARGTPDNPLTEEEIFEKVEALAGAAYPRLAQEMRGLLGASGETAGRSWREVVDAITAGTVPRSLAAASG
ncbi:MAG: MmgE/PrpD family protein [Acetobacterales bacterium]